MRNFLTNDAAIAITALKPSKGGNMEKARQAAFEVYSLLGGDYGRGAKSLAELALRVAKDASYGVIGPEDSTAIYEKFTSGAGEATGGAARLSINAKSSSLRQIILASKLDVDFIATLEAVRDAVVKAIAAKRKTRQLFEAFVSAARTQLKQDKKALSQAQISECVKPFGSAKPEASRAAKVAAAVEKLTPEEAKEVLAALHAKANGKPDKSKPRVMAAKITGDQLSAALKTLGISLSE
jgi:hypothetical protein